MEAPRICTIVPTYRRPALLRRALESVLVQTYPHFEVRVYDNASGDETAEVVHELAGKDSRIRYKCHPENLGMVANFNYGLGEVDTPLFNLLSDDDVLLPRFFETALRWLARYPEAMAFAGGVLWRDLEGRPLRAPAKDWPPGLYQPPAVLLSMLQLGVPLWTGMLLRAEVLKTLGGLDAQVAASDLDFELRLAARFPLVVAADPCACFTVHPGSSTRNIPPGEIRRVLAHVERSLGAMPELAAAGRRQARRAWRAGRRRLLGWYTHELQHQALLALARGDRRAARQKLAEAAVATPLRPRLLLRLARTFLPLKIARALSGKTGRGMRP